MAFQNFVPPLLNREQSGAMPDIISHLLGGYSKGMHAAYLPKQIEADIFHKQISPLAMLASSPFFSAMNPEQQQQIGNYISQMLSRQGIGGGQAFTTGQAQPQGNRQAGTTGAPNNNMPSTQEPITYDENGQPLTTGNMRENITRKYTEPGYTPGAPHPGEKGNLVYTPTGTNVEKGINVLTETKGLKKLFDEYAKIAPQVAEKGPLASMAGVVASNISKAKIPGISQAAQAGSEFLGTSNLPNLNAKMTSLYAQMAPAMRSIGFSNHEIQDMFTIHPGETGKNVQERFKNAWPFIERKIKTHQKNLYSGISVNNAQQKGQVAKNKLNQYKEPPVGSIGLYKDNQLYYIPQDKVQEALREGFSYE